MDIAEGAEGVSTNTKLLSNYCDSIVSMSFEPSEEEIIAEANQRYYSRGYVLPHLSVDGLRQALLEQLADAYLYRREYKNRMIEES